MNPPPSSPEPDYQRSWEEEELRRILHNSLPKLAERLNEEIANNPDLSARCIDPVDLESKADDTQPSHTNGLDVVPEDSNQEIARPKAEESAEFLSLNETPSDASSQAASARQHNQENIPPVRGRVYSTSDPESPELLLAPPSSPVARRPDHSSHTNGTE